MTNILLATINAKWIHPSLALRLLKANLGALEHQTEILEFALRQPLKEKVEPIIATTPRILGLSVSIWNHRATIELLEALEPEWGLKVPRPKIILGGPELSYLPPMAPIFRHADWVIRGEGELVFRELCIELLGEGKTPSAKPITLERLPSAQALEGKCIEARLVELTAIDPGYRLYTDEDLARKLVYMEASRGCPFGCEFCQGPVRGNGAGEGRVREFPLEPFLANMETLIKRGGQSAGRELTFKFLDRTFNLDISRARRIMEFFLEKFEQVETENRPLCVHFEMVPSRFPPELRELLRRFPPGTLRLEIGIQTFNPEVSVLINRPSNPEKELETIAFLRAETRAIIHADLIAGLPGEDLASFGTGFDRLWQTLTRGHETRVETEPMADFEIQPGILKRLPGAPIARHDENFGMRYASEPPYEVLETSALSRAELDRVKNFARFWELIVNRNAFPDLAAKICSPGKPVFQRFMALSSALLTRFNRNWGIDRGELRTAILATLPPREEKGEAEATATK